MASPVLEIVQERSSEEATGMSFLEHLEELRRRIVYSFLYLMAGFCVCWWYHDQIFAVMQKPITTALASHHMPQALVYLNPTDPFNMYMKVAFLAGIFVASPFVLYQVWAFIAPGLHRHESRYVLPFMLSTVGLFLAAGYFGYKLVYPASLDFLIGWSGQFKPMITISEYTGLFLNIIAGLGFVFEMPILVFFLALTGILTASWMWRNFRYAILVIFVIAAIITPTTDVMNMCIFAAPMIVLYLISIGIAWFVHPTQRRKRAATATGK
jgi:sec-independent protein translocase protein TatC